MTQHEGPSRRRFLGVTGMLLAATACGRDEEDASAPEGAAEPCAHGALPETSRRVALAKTGAPESNARAALDAWGGAESLFGPEDVVLFKVNSQWYAQGMTNTDVLAEMIRAVLERPGGFRGEIIVADNHHFKTLDSRGWTTDDPNGRVHLAGLVDEFAAAGHPISRVHWRDAGPNPEPWQGDAGGGVRVTEPGAQEGYRWWLDECHVTPEGQRCAMTWPVFRSPHSGALIDLRDGVLEEGSPSGQPLRMVNISSLNHHSRYAGVTASIKNLMGIVDMTCGFQGPEPAGYFNTHYIGMKSSHATWRWAKKKGGAVRRVMHRMIREEDAIDFEHTGGALGHWMRTVRRPDLNVVTAEWIGFGSRTAPELSARPGVVLASDDPVTLDAVAARRVLLPATRDAGDKGKRFLEHNDPDRREGPFHKFLAEARKEVGGTLDEADAVVELRS